ncbi:tetratricopeptide repeat protein [Flavobacterium sp. NRK1]|uniref:tetratricopeptide repeat protein n=1 Tax=Flavobacterium sp. NRK1 TaxID=2954929 RepID=UPI002093F0C3|nr:tetratricopeptide repeat protein [Flavobacterium sp. NRK1]MCO6148236.1 hypothetical protein [Flavobacterium sp. NRK1]
MNTKDYTYLLNKPYSLNDKQTAELENILSEFPFLQSARAIYLKGLYNQDSFRYNTELRKTAAYTTDRSILFDFITSEQFQSVDKEAFTQHEKALQSIPVNESEIIENKIETNDAEEQISPLNKLEESIKRSIQVVEDTETVKQQRPEAENRVEESIKNSIKATEDNIAYLEKKEELKPEPEKTVKETEEKLNIGRPLEFSASETHSFAEWLKLSKITPINREDELREDAKSDEIDESISKKMEIIDKFIETNPKIAPVKNITPTPANIEKSSQENSMLMTETLARVYLEQKKYSKAIQAYEILILKYPEKSVFFADRISDIKTIQQNNNLKNDA